MEVEFEGCGALFHMVGRRSWSSISDSLPELGLGTYTCVHVLQN